MNYDKQALELINTLGINTNHHEDMVIKAFLRHNFKVACKLQRIIEEKIRYFRQPEIGCNIAIN